MSKARTWFYTLNNYTEEEEKDVQAIQAKYHLYGRESGESGTPHLQGLISFPNPRALAGVKKLLPRAHLEIVKHLEESIAYCKKDGDIWESGTPPTNGRPTNAERMERNKRLRTSSLNELVDTGELSVLEVRRLKNARLDLAQEGACVTTEDVRGIWYYGKPGTGKSHKARTEYPDAYIKAQNKWFDGYQGEETIILDDFDCKELGHLLKIWADKWACSGEVKGGVVNLKHLRFIITSNYHPDYLWEDQAMREAIKRRFKITHFENPFEHWLK